jgi:uncharacterized membrane protein (UPF0182 family)
LSRLPGQNVENFLLLRPFVPVSRDNALTNLVSFMVANSDPDNYGQLQSFTMPIGASIAGPEQVSNAFVTNPAISQEFTLLGQQGSTVIQGSMQLIPVNNSVLYIRPVYVQGASGSQLPSFRFVLVYYAQRSVIDRTLDGALAQLFQNKLPPSAAELSGLPGTSPSTTTPTTPTTTPTPGQTAPPANGTVAQFLQQATDAYNDAQAALQRRDLAGYQAAVDRMAAALRSAQQAAGTTTTAPGSSATTTTTRPGTSPSSTPSPSS